MDALRARLEAVEAAVCGLDGPARDLVAAGLRDSGLIILEAGRAGDDSGGGGGGGASGPQRMSLSRAAEGRG
jgi:hypothetical protein